MSGEQRVKNRVMLRDGGVADWHDEGGVPSATLPKTGGGAADSVGATRGGRADVPEVPPWALEVVGGEIVKGSTEAWCDEASSAIGGAESAPPAPGALAVRVLGGDRFGLVSVRVRQALDLGAEAFEQGVIRAYSSLAAHLEGRRAHQPVRLWNFIPGILDPLADLPHRYMIFNSGRLEAYRRWLCSGSGFWQAIPTATGVGHGGADFVVHCLAAPRQGVPVENPRQRPAYRYSERYGPRPPCFARATRLEESPGGRPWLMVGGTASVLGEQTAHADDLDLQIDETLRNLEALVAEGLGGDPEGLERFRELRVYHPDPGDGAHLRGRLEGRFPGVERIELRQAMLCRPDLRVEIEGLVE